MRILGIVQARMGSTRLPGKVLKTVQGTSMLARTVDAALASGNLDEVIVAVPTEPEDDAIVEECTKLNVPCVRGPADDVLSRFIIALDAFPADAVMRFTADCPLLDPAIVSLLAQAFRSIQPVDYMSTAITRSLPRGMDAEVITAEALRSLDKVATGHHRTHVTSYAYTNPSEFRVLGLTFRPDYKHLRVTLDTPEDWRLVQAVIDQLGTAPIPWLHLADWLEANPKIRALNAEVRQKDLIEA